MFQGLVAVVVYALEEPEGLPIGMLVGGMFPSKLVLTKRESSNVGVRYSS